MYLGEEKDGQDIDLALLNAKDKEAVWQTAVLESGS
jgi:hypothetical protein